MAGAQRFRSTGQVPARARPDGRFAVQTRIDHCGWYHEEYIVQVFTLNNRNPGPVHVTGADGYPRLVWASAQYAEVF